MVVGGTLNSGMFSLTLLSSSSYNYISLRDTDLQVLVKINLIL